jgi:vWA-MoxR associated protein C-terminal domain
VTGLYVSWRDELAVVFSEIGALQNHRDLREAAAAHLRRRSIEVPDLSARTPRLQCDEILDAALASTGALDQLARWLFLYESSDNSGKFLQLARKLLPEGYLTLQEKADAIELLEPSARRESFGSYYRAVVRREADRPFDSLPDLITQAAEDWPGGDGLDPLLHIIALVARDTADRIRAMEHGRRAREYAARIDNARPAGGSTPSQADLIRRELARPAAARPRGPDEIAHIVLRLDPYSPMPDDLFFLSSWLFFGDQLVDRPSASSKALSLQGIKSEVIQLINDSIARAEQHSPQRFDSVIEFILPRAQMNLPVEKWSISPGQPVPLGTQYVVVIRDLDRQREPIRRQSWRDRWDRVGDGSTAAEQVISRWISCTEKFPEGELYRQMCLNETTGAGLTFPPESLVHDLKIWELLDSGMPIAVWPHQCGHTAIGATRDGTGNGAAVNGRAQFRQEFCAMSSGHPIRDLPGIVKRLRTKSDDLSDEHSGIALLWDDPTRIMNPAGFRLSAPGDPS